VSCFSRRPSSFASAERKHLNSGRLTNQKDSHRFQRTFKIGRMLLSESCCCCCTNRPISFVSVFTTGGCEKGKEDIARLQTHTVSRTRLVIFIADCNSMSYNFCHADLDDLAPIGWTRKNPHFVFRHYWESQQTLSTTSLDSTM